MTACARPGYVQLLALCGVVLALMLAAADAGAQAPAGGAGDLQRDELRGFTTVPGDDGVNVLVQQHGRDWRQLRERWLVDVSGWVLVGVLVAIGAFYAWRGTVKLEHGRSGRRIPRWSAFERAVHWTVAGLFILLAVTGLALLLGQALLVPLMGHAGFAGFAQYCLWLHNVTGPAFAVALAVMIVMWLKDNVFHRVDWEWFRQGGGIVWPDRHPSAERMNGGEKAWFWLLCTVGAAAVASGLVLDFPVFGQDRATMQVAHVVHGVSTVAWVAAFFGHVYIGTLGMEGSFESMTTGEVDANWAQQHHDIWYRRKLEGRAPEDDRPAQAPPLGASKRRGA